MAITMIAPYENGVRDYVAAKLLFTVTVEEMLQMNTDLKLIKRIIGVRLWHQHRQLLVRSRPRMEVRMTTTTTTSVATHEFLIVPAEELLMTN